MGRVRRCGTANTVADYPWNFGATSSTDPYPNCPPIASYQSTFDGKGYTIVRLTIAGANTNAGLLAVITAYAVIRDLGIITPIISSSGASANVGALAGNNGGLMTASYASGGAITVTGPTPKVGGLIGQNSGDIRVVWSDASVNASTIGAGNGLIGNHNGYTGGIYEAWAISLTPGDNTLYALWNSGEKPPTTPPSTAPPTAKSP